MDEAIIDKISARGTSRWVSVEFFPPKTEAGVKHLLHAVDNLSVYNPVFSDFTWGAGGSTSELTVELCERTKLELNATPNMHLTCTNMESEKIDTALERLKKNGIVNIFALRGDPPLGQEKWTATDKELSCALDLIRYIRVAHGDYFCIGCAGYPEGHPTKMAQVDDMDGLSPSEQARCSIEYKEDGSRIILVCKDADYESELDYLKQKVDAGASYIITQMFFDANVFITFVNACRVKGITVPIIPGIMCISTYGGFKRMTGFCKTRVPDALHLEMEAVKADEHAVKELGFQFGINMCKSLLAAGFQGLHFYTLNTSALTSRILDALEYPKLARDTDIPKIPTQATAPTTVFTLSSETANSAATTNSV